MGKLLLLIYLQFNSGIKLHPDEDRLSTFILALTKYEGCDSLGKTSLTTLVGNHWATGGLRVNLISVKGGLLSFPLCLLEETAIMPMTAEVGCV